MTPEISVLIPVYNAEKYLLQCLRSLQEQTFSDFEIICVDDGSIDDSYTIIQKAALKDSRIRLLEQTNQGVAAARNRLLSEAAGKYVTFVDADDRVAPDYLAELYYRAEQEKADLTRCFFFQYDQTKQCCVRLACSSKLYAPVAEGSLSQLRTGLYDSVVWGKLYRRAWLRAQDIHFLNGYVAEDAGFSVLAFFLAGKISTLKKQLYFYRKGNPQTITQNSEKMYVGMLKNHLFVWDEIQRRGRLHSSVACELQRRLIGDICRFRKLPTEKIREYEELVMQTVQFLRARRNLLCLRGRFRNYCVLGLAGKHINKWFFFWMKVFR